jgi:membrane-bound serine protease (ClpP class)
MRMDTPGGLDTAMRAIVRSILGSRVPVAVFVEPSGARAASAGLFITMAGHVAAMAPGTNIGAAHPVTLGEGEVSPTLEDKVTNDAVAYLQAIAEQRGRNAEWAEEAVRRSASLAAASAVNEGVVDLLARDLDDLLAILDGRTIAMNGWEVTLALEGAAVEPYPMTVLEELAHALVDPNIAYILLTLGMIALVAEFYNPGAIVPGVTGVISLILAFVSLGSLPVNWGGIALIALAVVFFILDTQVSGFALTVAGVVAFVLGSLLLFSPFSPIAPALPAVSVNPWVLAAMTLLLAGFFTIAVSAGLRAQRAAPVGGMSSLVGRAGVVVADLNPQGVVLLQSEDWTAVPAGGEHIPAGTVVEVTAVDGLRLVVQPTQRSN